VEGTIEIRELVSQNLGRRGDGEFTGRHEAIEADERRRDGAFEAVGEELTAIIVVEAEAVAEQRRD
jgi:hypothetical protein